MVMYMGYPNILADLPPNADSHELYSEYLQYCCLLRKLKLPYGTQPVYHFPMSMHCNIQNLTKSVVVLNAGKITSSACVVTNGCREPLIYPDGWTVATIFAGQVIVVSIKVVSDVITYKCDVFDQSGNNYKSSDYNASPVEAISEVFGEFIMFPQLQGLVQAVAGVGPMCVNTNKKLLLYFADSDNKNLISEFSGYRSTFFSNYLNNTAHAFPCAVPPMRFSPASFSPSMSSSRSVLTPTFHSERLPTVHEDEDRHASPQKRGKFF